MKHNKRSICFVMLVGWMMVLSVQLSASELENDNGAANINNTGFISDPPKEMRTRFPMCDAFLQVEWINKDKKIGHSTFDLYKGGKKDGRMKALIYLDKHYPSDRIDLYDFEKKNELKMLFTSITKGTVNSATVPIVKYLSYKAALYGHNTESEGFTYADNHLTVCVPYPGNQLVWIAEGKNIRKIYNDNEFMKLHKKIQEFFPKITDRRFGLFSTIDINFDGTQDFFDGGGVMYSFKKNFYVKEKFKDGMVQTFYKDGEEYFNWNFPPFGNSCATKAGVSDYITTDGKNYFLNNQCNLTELTKGEN